MVPASPSSARRSAWRRQASTRRSARSAGCSRLRSPAYRAQSGTRLLAALEAPDAIADRLSAFLNRAAELYTDPGVPPGCLAIETGRSCSDPAVLAVVSAARDELRARIAEAVGLERPELAASLADDMMAALSGLCATARDGAERQVLVHAAATFALGLRARLAEPGPFASA